MNEQKQLKIVELQVENFKRITVATIKPDGSTVVIGGNNAQGKSSAIDAIFAALQGKGAIPAAPIHDGEEAGKITLDLGEYIVVRTFKEGGKTSLTVSSTEGARFAGPQELLNKFSENLGFDPQAFNRLTAADQCQAIAAITGIDFAGIAAERKTVYSKRTDVNRELKTVQAQYDGMKSEIDDSLPLIEIVLSDVLAEIEEANKHNEVGENLFNDKRDVLAALVETEKMIDDRRKQIEEITKGIDLLQAQHSDQTKASVDIGKDMAEFKPISTDELKLKLSTAEETNKKIARQVVITTCSDRLKKGTTMADDLTAEIKAIDDKKAEAIAAAEMPVPGLDIEDGGVMLDGHPFSQASSAEQIKACVLIGLAMNPTLRVLIIRDGSLLDEENLALIAKIAEENNAQVWIERVGAGSEVGFVMEDGKVK